MYNDIHNFYLFSFILFPVIEILSQPACNAYRH